jgi:hypothetical protein
MDTPWDTHSIILLEDEVLTYPEICLDDRAVLAIFMWNEWSSGEGVSSCVFGLAFCCEQP